LQTIGDAAFQSCVSLTGVTIPNKVTSIGRSAFYGCSRLASVTFEAGSRVNSIGNEAFQQTSLVSVSLPDSLTSLGGHVFYGVTTLETVATGNGLISLPSFTFSGCTRLKTVTLGAGLLNIGYSAFSGCSALQGVGFPAGLQTIGNSAFWGCVSLTDVTVPNTVTSIEGYAFDGCSKLASVTFAAGSRVNSIGEEAFQGTSLVSVSLPDSLTSLGNDVFPRVGTLTVVSGTGSGSYVENTSVPIVADAATNGAVFDKWVTYAGRGFASATSASTTFRMPAKTVTVTATYKYALMMDAGGTGVTNHGGNYVASTFLCITARDAERGKVFDKWITSDGGTFASETSARTTFMMPANATTITATYKDAPVIP
jgi:hypothetical protein